MFFEVADEVIVEDKEVTRLKLDVNVLLADVLLVTSRAPSMPTVAAEGLSVEYFR